MTQAETTPDLDELRDVVVTLFAAGATTVKLRRTPKGTWDIEVTKATAAPISRPLTTGR